MRSEARGKRSARCCGLAVNHLMLIVSRGGQGIGGAIMFATSLALLGHSFRGRARGTAFGVRGAVVGIATAAGPVLGGNAMDFER